MSLHLFLDTNVFLSFFHFSDDDLGELRKLTGLVKEGQITLLLPDQVRHEFGRNRDIRVAEAIRILEDSKLPTGKYPRLFHDYPEYKPLVADLEDYEKLRRTLIESVRRDAPARSFAADETTRQLFDVATHIEVTSELMARAEQRFRRGNPPGKQDRRESLGDAINWEALLSVGEGNLHLVAQDSDWATPLDPKVFNSYLLDEWRSKAGGEVRFYLRLKSFLDENLPAIKLSSEKDALLEELAFSRAAKPAVAPAVDTNALIYALSQTGSFAGTHQVIAQLERIDDFDAEQVNSIVAAYVTNDQVHGIMRDIDVKRFLLRTLHGREDEVDRALMDALADLVSRYHSDDAALVGLVVDFIPF